MTARGARPLLAALVACVVGAARGLTAIVEGNDQILRQNRSSGSFAPASSDLAMSATRAEVEAAAGDLLSSGRLAEVEVSDGDRWVPEPSTTTPQVPGPRPWGSLRCGDTFDIQSSQTFKYSKGRHSGIKRIRSHEICVPNLDYLAQQPGTFDDSSAARMIMKEPRPRSHWIAFGVTAGGILAISLVLLAAYNAWADSIRRRTGITLTHVCCLAFMLLSISIDISMKSAAKAGGHGQYNFDPAVAVLIVELFKLVFSVGLVAASELPRLRKGEKVELPGLEDCFWLAVPGAVYTATNIIAYQAIENIPLATFSVLRETRLFWNAFLWVLIFQLSLTRTRWLGVSGIFFGCTISQVPAMLKSEFSPEVAWVLVLAFLTATGGVMTEYAMKQRAAIDLNLQGCIMYAASSFFTLVFLVAARRHLFVGAAVFFQGFEPECMQIIALQVLQGLTVSRILKHVESVTKSIISSLCSPLLTFIGSAVMKYQLRLHEVIAALVVLCSCCLYLKEGPLKSQSKDGVHQPRRLSLTLKGEWRARDLSV